MNTVGSISPALKPVTTHMLTNAAMKSIPKPAYAHSLTFAGTLGIISANEPSILNTEIEP